MPALQTVLSNLNYAFSKNEVAQLIARREDFAPGKPLDLGFATPKGTPLYRAWRNYIKQLPESFQDTLRGIIFYSLSTKPSTPLTFAWAPGYDYELAIWHAPDTRETRGGITVLIKSRYPIDKHPLLRSK